MSELQHGASAFAAPLKDLAEGRTDPEAWLAWWQAHAADLEASCPRGWFLKLKPGFVHESANRAALTSQDGACMVLQAIQIPFVRSERYQRAWQTDFERFCQEQKTRDLLRAEQYAPQIAALAKEFPKLARFLTRRATEFDQLATGAAAAEIARVEQSLGVPLPGAVRRFFECTRELKRDGFALELCAMDLEAIELPVGQIAAGSVRLGEYWLEGDGDLVLFERTPTPEDDPPVYYHAHDERTKTAKKLAPSFTTWLESLPKSRVFRD